MMDSIKDVKVINEAVTKNTFYFAYVVCNKMVIKSRSDQHFYVEYMYKYNFKNIGIGIVKPDICHVLILHKH